MSEIQKVLNYPRGGGGKPNWEFFPNFPVFLVMAPLSKIDGTKLTRSTHSNQICMG